MPKPRPAEQEREINRTFKLKAGRYNRQADETTWGWLQKWKSSPAQEGELTRPGTAPECCPQLQADVDTGQDPLSERLSPVRACVKGNPDPYRFSVLLFLKHALDPDRYTERSNILCWPSFNFTHQ